ncbi:hypothetical protein Dsin_011554 [Dipteronia sinensis]|uniref:H15 domain-containing protein n=1 Tax=Dipteronia sinensis TaxID=43782 RepID=A0AAE0EDX4_9ROSI|nr:hypothetical protein Dsin_011554 [Dipteronia sinensis]
MDPFSVTVGLDNQPSPPHPPPQQQPSVVFLPLHQFVAASPAAPPALNHPPPYPEMIYAAITALKEKGGSSKRAIEKHIKQTYSNLPPNHSALLTHHLHCLKNSGHLLMFKKSYKLPGYNAAVPMHKKKSRTKRPVGRPRKVQAQVQAKPISSAKGEGNAAVPMHKKSKRRPVGRPRKVQAEANVAVPMLKKSKRRPVGRSRKVFQASLDDVVLQTESLANDVRCLQEELQALTAKMDLVKHNLTAANEKLKHIAKNFSK